MLKKILLGAIAAMAITAAPAHAIVGGSNAAPGEYPSVAKITFGNAFSCTGTVIAPTWVLTAGHCESLTGAAVGTPVGWPGALIDVRVGSVNSNGGTKVPVKRAFGHENYLATQGYDISLLELSSPAPVAATKVAGASERASWNAGVLEEIVGFGVTEEGGDAPAVLEKAQVPIVSDSSCAAHYDSFEAATQVCAGYPQGGVDTCQGDSGGPMFGRVGGALRVVGTTSYGEGCARPDTPGVYGRVGDNTLREWIRSKAPAGVSG